MKENDGQGQQSTAEQQTTPQPPYESSAQTIRSNDQAIADTLNTSTSTQEAKKTNKELESIRLGELWLIGLNVGLLIVGASVCIIYGLQLAVMRSQLHVMRETLNEMRSGSADTHDLAGQAKNQADAAKAQSESTKAVALNSVEQAKATNKLATEFSRSADAAVANSKSTQAAVVTGEKNLLLAERVMFVQERPWVGISSFNATVESDKPITGNITFTNFGHSPAFDAGIITACTFDRAPSVSIESSYIFVNNGSKSIMMPGSAKGTDGLSCDLHLSAQQFNAVEQGLKIVYLFGMIRYRDSINTANPSHATRFCGHWNPKTKMFDDCVAYNSAD